ncbi:MAG: hypothetical protein K8F91_24595, partial [Candidatus Obscuribacterales bacterium]|nr:hypothetical protein [Candidatus Obscuribacterales bacterium]
DIYDDDLLEQFSHYVDQIEEALRKASYTFSESPPPPSLAESVQWMRYSIAQAADGLEELQEFLENYNYSHLCMADNLFKIAIEHTRRANFLTRG